MLIVCPSCATSYMIDTASLGASGRMVRCARCKATWFTGGPQGDEDQQVSAFVDEAIAEAETEPEPFLRAPAGEMPPPTIHFGDQPTTDGFDASDAQPAIPDAAGPVPAPVPNVASEPQPKDAAAHHSVEPETIAESPSLVPTLEETPEESHEAQHEADDVESFAARRRRLKSRRKQAKRSSRWTAVILALFAFNVALIGDRSEVVRFLPQTASLFAAIGLPVNLRELKFENVRISPSGRGGEGLTVHGTIVSIADKPVKVPVLRFAVRNAAGQEIYTWTTPPKRTMLDPGAKLTFSSELAATPADAKDVLVRFVTAQDPAGMTMSKPGQPDGDH